MTQSEFELIARLLRSKEPVISGMRMVIFDQVDSRARCQDRVGSDA